MFSPDRDPHPVVSEIRFLQQPVLFLPGVDSEEECLKVLVDSDGAASTVLRVKNRYTFRDLSHLSWSWHLVSNRSTKPLRTGHFDLPCRHDVQDIVLILDSAISSVRALEESRSALGNKFFLNIRGYLSSEMTWAQEGHILVRQQFRISFKFDDPPVPHPPPNSSDGVSRWKSLLVTNEANHISVSFHDNPTPFATLEKDSGSLIAYSPYGSNLLEAGVKPNFTRAATDNDKGGMELTLDFMFPFKVDHFYKLFRGHDEFSYHHHWRRFGLLESSPPRVKCLSIETTKRNADEKVEFQALCTVLSSQIDAEILKIKVLYTCFSDARICISYHVIPQAVLRGIPSLPRVGVNFQLQPRLKDIQYFGRGPEENYPDRKSGSEMGIYETTPSDMGYLKYIVPCENGSRSDCEWISFLDSDGKGLCALLRDETKIDANFSCSALLYSSYELDVANHTCDLKVREEGPIHVNLDHKLMGLGGDNSWFPVVYPEFHVKPHGEFKFQVWLMPVTKDDEPALVAGSI